jgi:hypothetical protein
LSIRHYYAQLIDASSSRARYRFTPDSVTKAQWGTVEFDLLSFEYRITEHVPHPAEAIQPEEVACLYLGRKLAKHFAAGGESAPQQLEWVS